MHRWLSALLAAAILMTTGAQVTQAQTPAGQGACQQLIFQTALPALQASNRFNPGGIFPVGYWPLTQPWGSNPNEPAYSGFPTSAYFSSYAVPGWAQANPMAFPGAYPGSGILPGLVPEGVEVNQTLTSAGILQRLQSDGTFDRLSPTEQADWLFRLASLQRDEINQRFTQASLQQNAENTMLNLRRAPIELSLQAQERSRNWRDSYALYAATIQNLVNTACNTTTGGIPGFTPGAAVGAGAVGPVGVGGTVGGVVAGTVCLGPGNPFGFCIGLGNPR